MIKKIHFICDYSNRNGYKLIDLPNYQYYDLVGVENEATFSIKINNNTFFSDSNFNILEFLQQIAFWEINKGDMKYNCVDTDDNPLISFIEENGLYTIHSPWQKFECNDKFSFADLISVKEILTVNTV